MTLNLKIMIKTLNLKTKPFKNKVKGTLNQDLKGGLKTKPIGKELEHTPNHDEELDLKDNQT